MNDSGYSYLAERERKGGGECNAIPPLKVIHFITLFNRITKEKGGRIKAAQFVGISEGTYQKMLNDSFLSDKSARKILSAFNQLFQGKT